ncbi:MAG: UDP-N-acetylmuramate--L-alanine ligase [Prevotellaceae bacterium]|jgi:UDP-N-acetylmuramate--alanine ligase|nr:UDP-N-acetylmuramate--L-alanine ligase [Prevotellaceae bacterium]
MKKNYSRYYFIGIGGIGMSALARYFKSKGYDVAGYDRTESNLTKELQNETIEVAFSDDVSKIPDKFTNPDTTLVVITPAIPADSALLCYFKSNNFDIRKRSEVLGRITKDHKAICVAGTHGKTTVSTITAHLLHQSAVSCSAFLGGIANNYNTNLLLSRESNWVVVEADEYDRSFHHLSPYMALITSTEPDHLDIYGTAEAFCESFEHFTSLIRPGGSLVMHKNVDIHPRSAEKIKIYTYSQDDKESDFYADNIRLTNGEFLFDFVAPTARINDVRLNSPIRINVENSIAAMTLAWLCGVSSDELRTGISSYSGVYRRFNVIYKSDRFFYIDDYAHHPGELKASISSIREAFPGRKMTGIFQPHLYSRTRDFADDFATVLSGLDQLILLDIYPAREEPIAGVDAKMMLDKVTIPAKKIYSKTELIAHIKDLELDVVVTFGAGDIDTLPPLIKEELKKKDRETI